MAKDLSQQKLKNIAQKLTSSKIHNQTTYDKKEN